MSRVSQTVVSNILEKQNLSEDDQLFLIRTLGQHYLENLLKMGVTPSESVQLAAVTHNEYSGSAIVYLFKNGIIPSEKVQLAAIKHRAPLDLFYKYPLVYPSETFQLEAIKKNPYNVTYIKNPSEVVQLAAVTRDGTAIRKFINPSRKVQLAAIKNKPFLIKDFENPSEDEQLVVVLKKNAYIKYIANPTELVQLIAVREHYPNLKILLKKGIVVTQLVKEAAAKAEATSKILKELSVVVQQPNSEED